MLVAAPARKLMFVMLDDLLRLFGRRARAGQRRARRSPPPRAPRAPPSCACVVAPASVARASSTAAWRCIFSAARWPLSKIGTLACSSNRQLFCGTKNCAG